MAKAKRYDVLLTEKEKVDQELLLLRNKLKKQQAAENKGKPNFDSTLLSVDDIPFSFRAKSALEKLSIRDSNDLKTLTVLELDSIPGIGVKTIHEIVRRAEEIGITIT